MGNLILAQCNPSIPNDVIMVNMDQTSSGSFGTIWVCNNATLNLSGGFFDIFLEPGSTLILSGGSHDIFVQSGANITTLGGVTDIYYVDFADLTINSGIHNLMSCPSITFDLTNAPATGCNPILNLGQIPFYGTLVDEKVLLEWAIPDDLILSKLILEKSSNSIDWTEIAQVDPNPTINSSYLDFGPVAIQSYYRLKLERSNQPPIYSDIIVIEAPTQQARLNVFPNPTNEKLFLTLENQLEINTIELVDQNGSVHFRSELIPSYIDVSSYPKGFYQLYVTYKKGSISRKILIQ